jgi:hypothetical protein
MKTLLKLVVIFMCVFIASIADPQYMLSIDEKIVNKITLQVAKKISAEKGLIPAGSGGQMMDEIKMLMLGFDYRKIANIETARELLVYCVEEYLAEINTSEEIRPYLCNYPFTNKNIQIDICFFNPDGTYVPIDDIIIATADEGKIAYRISKPDRLGLQTIYQESYEEAVQKVKK